MEAIKTKHLWCKDSDFQTQAACQNPHLFGDTCKMMLQNIAIKYLGIGWNKNVAGCIRLPFQWCPSGSGKSGKSAENYLTILPVALTHPHIPSPEQTLLQSQKCFTPEFLVISSHKFICSTVAIWSCGPCPAWYLHWFQHLRPNRLCWHPGHKTEVPCHRAMEWCHILGIESSTCATWIMIYKWKL